MLRIKPAIIALAILSSSSCATATIEDAVPAGAMQPVPAQDASRQANQDSKGPDTDEFPNLNEVKIGETAQLTDAERDADLEKLREAKNSQRSGALSGTSRSAELNRLADSHAEETLRIIEGE